MWYDWIKSLYDRSRELARLEGIANQDREIRLELSRLYKESEELIQGIIAARNRFSSYHSQARVDSETQELDQKVAEWICNTSVRLDELRMGWGLRFKTVGTPTQEDTDIGGNRFHHSAGMIRLHQRKLSGLIEDLDKSRR